MARQKSISIPITGNNAPLRKTLKDSEKQLTAFGKLEKKWSAASAAAYGVAGSAVFQFGKAAVQAAMEDQKAQALLADQLQKTIGANAATVKATESYIETLMLATNVSDDKLRPALASLVRVTGDLTKAQGLLGVAVDLSTATGKDLEAVTTALGKAAMGQTTALGRLGLGLSQATLAGGDFNAILREITLKTGGAAAAALDTTAGKVQNLQIRFDELKEQIGTELLPVVEDVATKLLGISDAVQEGNYVKAGKDAAESASSFISWATGVDLVTGAIRNLNPFAKESEDQINSLTKAVETSAAELRLFDEVLSNVTRPRGRDLLAQQFQASAADKRAIENKIDLAAATEKVGSSSSSAGKKVEDTEKKQRKAYRDTAKALREDLAKALEESRKNLKDAQDAAKEFGDQFAYSFGVSLAGAYDKAQGSEENYTDALKARKDAYDALDLAKAGTDLNAYLKALQDVKTAEEGVTAAQQARITPAAAFAAQIADAKTFGANLKTLIGDPYKLGQAGLQQLLDLGPTAGAKVTSDLIAGTAGFTTGELNASLADLAGIQAGLSSGVTAALGGQYTAAVSAAQSQVDALSSAGITAAGGAMAPTIVVNAGVGDPVAIGAQVKSVLQSYDQRAGKLTVQGPKKKAKKK